MNPLLTEPGVKYFLSKQFENYKIFKEKNISLFVNISLLIVLITIIFCFLYFSYRGKLTKTEIAKINETKRQYVLSKINQFQKFKNKSNYNTITNLPTLEKM